MADDEFFDEIIQSAVRDARRRGVRVAPAVWEALQKPAAPPRVEDVPERAPQPPVGPREDNAAPAPVRARTAVLAATVLKTVAAPPPILPNDWEALRQAALQCRRCRLAETRHSVVFGEGDLHAGLMFIGEGPGADEDAAGRPFVGEAGRLLDKMILAMKFRREEVYIANVVKCRPPGNRVPQDDEAAECIGYLRKQIELVRPEVIVLLGATALRFLLGKEGIRRCRGVWHDYRGIPVMPTYHPAYLLRQNAAKRDVWNDLKLVMKHFGKL